MAYIKKNSAADCVQQDRDRTKLSGSLRYTGGVLLLYILCCIFSCQDEKPRGKETRASYRAINKNDTAMLDLTFYDKAFYGKLVINFNGTFKDSGEVNGVLKGDTLKGTYYFRHIGTAKRERDPISLLKKDNKLIMGVGTIEIYMNMRFFKKTEPIDYEKVKYTFEQIN